MTLHEPIAIPTEQKAWPLRVQDFLLLHQNGAFEDYARAELLDGEIWVLNAIHSRHAAVQSDLHGRLWTALSPSTGLRCYLTPSVEMGDKSLPEPDIVVGEPHNEGFLPFAKVRLVIEVSDTTLDIDMGRKQRIYAAAAIPEYWVADLNACSIHQMWSPANGDYGEHREVVFGDSISSLTIAGLEIPTISL